MKRLASRSLRRLPLLAALVCLLAVATAGRPAVAFHGWRHGGWGYGGWGHREFGWGGFGGPAFGWGRPGFGFGGPAFGWGRPGFGWGGPAFGWGGPGFGFGGPRFGFGGWAGASRFAYSNYFFLGGPGLIIDTGFGGLWPGFGGGWCGPGVGFGGWGYPYVYPPLILPPGGWLPGGFAPVFGPAGVLPYMRFGAAGVPQQALPGRLPLVGGGLAPLPLTPAAGLAARGAALPAGGMAPAFPRPAFGVGLLEERATPRIAVRSSSPQARLRAARFVATGDRHLRAAVGDRPQVWKALQAYRQAHQTAPDQPDTLLRQAIALTALEKPDEVARVFKRLEAIDSRLTDSVAGGPPAVAAAGMVPEVVFGDRPAGAPSPVSLRSIALLEKIFAAGAGAEPVDGQPLDAKHNWIARRWAQRDGQPLWAVARK